MSTTRRAAALLTGLAMGAACLIVGDLTGRSLPGTPVAGDGQASTGSFPQSWAGETLRGMTLEQKVGQLFVTVTYGDTADATDSRNRRDFGVDTPAEVVGRYHLGGVIYFDETAGLRSPRQIAELSNGLQLAARESGAGVPLLISTDQENGAVVRIGPPVTPLPTAGELGAAGSTRAALVAAQISGRELRAMGVNHDLAPVADVNLNPGNPVLGRRTFSSDPILTAAMTGAQVTGYQESVAATAKHFPGHGGTSVDSHTGIAVIDHDRARWEQVDAPPFRSAIAAGVDSIMLGHIALPKLDPSGLPATLSPALVDGLLRRELGFDGVVITDSLRMRGVRAVQPDDRIVVSALAAGADQLLMPVDLDLAYRSVLDAVRGGELTEARVDASVRRILELKWRRGLVAEPMVDVAAVEQVVGSAANRELVFRLTDRASSTSRGNR